MAQSFTADLLNDAPCGSLIFNDQGRITYVNNTLSELLAYTPGELIGKHVETILTLANRIFYQTHFFPLLKLHGKANEIFLTLLTKNKTEVHVLTNAVRSDEESETYHHCIFMPVTERRKYENELLAAKKVAEDALLKNELLIAARTELEAHKMELDRQIVKLSQLNREVREFSKVISHDIQEPIRKISLFADLALHEPMIRDNVVVEKSFDRIKSSCLKMARMVNCLEAFIAIDNADATLTPTDLNNIITRSKSKVIRNTGFTDITIHSDPLPVIKGYEDQLEILFYNLMENAVKFRKPGMEVLIDIRYTTFQENSYKSTSGSYRYIDMIQIKFSDNGKGFQPAYAEHIFRLFQKLDPESEGLGLGLALCKKVTDNHFGGISVHTEPGNGTTFTILLPLVI
jgi:sigma-B regulation protein RsbU (phosphoserine phosphatase)